MPSLAATTSSLDPYPSTEMVRLAEDGAMFKIARFEKQFRYGWAAKSSESPAMRRPASLSASQKLFLTYADARNLRRCYWNRSTEAQP
jgi:hypothetical protein